jgi:hypothetical protein
LSTCRGHHAQATIGSVKRAGVPPLYCNSSRIHQLLSANIPEEDAEAVSFFLFRAESLSMAAALASTQQLRRNNNSPGAGGFWTLREDTVCCWRSSLLLPRMRGMRRLLLTINLSEQSLLAHQVVYLAHAV